MQNSRLKKLIEYSEKYNSNSEHRKIIVSNLKDDSPEVKHLLEIFASGKIKDTNGGTKFLSLNDLKTYKANVGITANPITEKGMPEATLLNKLKLTVAKKNTFGATMILLSMFDEKKEKQLLKTIFKQLPNSITDYLKSKKTPKDDVNLYESMTSQLGV